MGPRIATQTAGSSSPQKNAGERRGASTRHRGVAAIGEALERRSLLTAVTGFALIDATTDRPVPGYESVENGAIINLRALPGGLLNLAANADDTTDSVRFTLDGRVDRSDRAAPFVLLGDDGANLAGGALSVGEHRVTATPYAPMVGRTTSTARAGPTETITFKVVDRPVVKLALYDADADEPITGYLDLRPGATIDLASLPTRNLTIRAGVEALSAGKVEFTLDNMPPRTEFVAPFALFGDDGDGNLFGGALSVGTHTLVVRTAAKGDATTFDSETRTTFTVIDSRSAKPTFVPTNAWTSTFNAAGTRTTFGVNGGKLKTSPSTATVQLNGRTLEADEFVLKSGSIRLLAPLEAGENLVELSVRSAADRSRVRGSFALWAGTTTVSVSAAGATQAVKVVATLNGAPVASETYIPAGGSGVIGFSPDAPIRLDGTDVGGQGYGGDTTDGPADKATVRPTSSTPSPGPNPTPAPNEDGSLTIYAAIGDLGVSAHTVAGVTAIVCDAGAGKIFGTYQPGGEWMVGGWAGPHQEVDQAALEDYLSHIPVGSIYLSNSFEDKLGSKLEQITTVLKAAHERGLTVGWYGMPGLRWGRDMAEWKADNDLVMKAIGPYLDWMTPSYYFNDTSEQIPGYLKELYGESLDEALRLQGDRPIVPTISPYTHDGREVPISTTLELVKMFRDRGISQVTLWTDRTLTPHVQATIDALAAA